MRVTRFAAVLVGASLVSGAASAQGTPWSYTARIYGWLPALDASVDTRFGEVESSGSGSDALSALDMAFMGTFEARRGKWGLIGDLLYVDLSNSEATPRGEIFDEARIGMKATALSGYAAYRVYETEAVAFDIAGGFRAFDLSVDTSLNAASDEVQDRGVSQSASWVDPLLAARVIAPFGENWFATGFVDAGGFVTESSSTWQAVGTVGYRFDERWSAQFGYRYMNIEKEINGRDVELDLYGPLVGVSFSF